MHINGVTPSQLYSQATIERKEGLSGIDIKVHAFVVLSYILIGIGILIACSSPYIAFTIHPMVAMAAPVVPIALGVKLKTMAHNSNKIGPENQDEDSHISPLRGIRNDGMNCWLNASLQAVFNIPVFRKQLERCSAYSWRLGPVVKAFQQYEADQCHEGKKVSEVNSQPVREWLSSGLGKRKDGTDIVSPDIRVQESPTEFFSYFLRQIGHSLPAQKGYQILKEKNKASETSYFPDDSIDFFNLNIYYFEDSSLPLSKAFQKYFNDTIPISTGTRTIRKYLTNPPEDFFVGLSFAGDDHRVHTKQIDVPMYLDFTKEQFGKESSYQCDLFFIHIGDHTEFGHYEAALCVKGHWWLASDSRITPLSTKKAQEMMRTAPFLHYSKVQAAPAA